MPLLFVQPRTVFPDLVLFRVFKKSGLSMFVYAGALIIRSRFELVFGATGLKYGTPKDFIEQAIPPNINTPAERP